ncbi:MAG: hypothetical protein WD021_09460, partial [Rhodothermales bacterium]
HKEARRNPEEGWHLARGTGMFSRVGSGAAGSTPSTNVVLKWKFLISQRDTNGTSRAYGVGAA